MAYHRTTAVSLGSHHWDPRPAFARYTASQTLGHAAGGQRHSGARLGNRPRHPRPLCRAAGGPGPAGTVRLCGLVLICAGAWAADRAPVVVPEPLPPWTGPRLLCNAAELSSLRDRVARGQEPWVSILGAVRRQAVGPALPPPDQDQDGDGQADGAPPDATTGPGISLYDDRMTNWATVMPAA